MTCRPRIVNLAAMRQLRMQRSGTVRTYTRWWIVAVCCSLAIWTAVIWGAMKLAGLL